MAAPGEKSPEKVFWIGQSNGKSPDSHLVVASCRFVSSKQVDMPGLP